MHNEEPVLHPPLPGMVWIPGGTFRMGLNDFYPEEQPVHQVTVDGFWMDEHPVTNAEFGRFVGATGYVTIAECAPDPAEYPGVDPSLLVPGSLVFRRSPHRVSLSDHYLWWAYVPGASWKYPEGRGSALDRREAHPVVGGYIAMPALGVLLILAGFRSLKPSDISSVWSTGWPSRIAAVVTFVSTLILPIQVAVGLGVLLSALLYINHSSRDVSLVQLVKRPDGLIEERNAPKKLSSHEARFSIATVTSFTGALAHWNNNCLLPTARRVRWWFCGCDVITAWVRPCSMCCQTTPTSSRQLTDGCTSPA